MPMRVALKLEPFRRLVADSPLSQNHWAIRLGLSKGHLSDLLAGRHPYPSARTRERMLEVFGVPFDQLFEVEPGHDLPDYAIQRALHDHYIVDREIGHGGMGRVYLARDLRLGRTVAIKIVSDEAVGGVGSRALLKEIVNTNRLQHPNILPVLDAGEVDGSPYYVMPHVRGGSLRDAVARHERLSIARTLAILAGLAAALDDAHTQGVLHCDVKPANILLAGDHPWLIDFGVARVIQTEVFTGDWHGEFDSGAGTPGYVSPEQARGERRLDGRTDVYSLACVVYEMLTGEPPFRGPTTLATVARRFTEPPPDVRRLAPQVPEELARAIRHGMAVDREERTPSAGALLRECRQAVRAAGSVVGVSGVTAATSTTLRSRTTAIVGAAAQDLRFALRSLLRAPAVAIAVALTLGFGVGVNAMMFGLLDQLFFRFPPGVGSPTAVQRIYVSRTRLNQQRTSSALAYPEIEDLRRTGSFRGVAAYFDTRLAEGTGADAHQVAALDVTHDFWNVLQVRPALGRVFTAAEDVEGAPGTVVLGYAYWRGHFGGAPDVIGRTLHLASGDYQVIGVAPAGFNGIDLKTVDVYLPLAVAAHENIGGPWQTSRGIRWLHAVSRLAAGVTPAGAEAAATLQLQNGASDARAGGGDRAIVAPLLAARGPLASGESRVSLWLGGVALVLLAIACANAVNLMMARMTQRRSELALRAALGAGWWRLVWTIAVEMLALALLAAVVALLLAAWGSAILTRTVIPGSVSMTALAQPRVITFTLVVALAAGLVAGLAPMWRSARPDVMAALKQGRGGSAAHDSRLRSGLLVLQTSLSVVLLIAAGLFVRSMTALRHVDVGLDLDQLVGASVNFAGTSMSPAAALAAEQQAMDAIRRLPGVTAVTGSNVMTFLGNWAEDLSIPGIDTIPVPRTGGPYINIVGADWFRAVGTPIVTGRGFTTADRLGAARVAVVGATMARLIWPGQNPIGKCMRIGGDTMPCTEIVGVAHDAPRSELLDTENAQYYVPAAQYQPDQPHQAMYVRTNGDPARLVGPVRRILQAMAPDMEYQSVVPLRQLTASETRSWQVGSTLFSLSGMLAVIVAALGLYSLLSFSVAQRTREFGIRTALGATARGVLQQVFRGAFTLVGIGLSIGVVVALAGANLIAPLLFHTSPRDPTVYLVVAAMLAGTAVLACLLPALRATRVDPVIALRSE
jgi:putative ABC transport system permease protein